MLIESTRNGMSSVTMSMTLEVGSRAARSPALICTSARPWGLDAANSACAIATAAIRSGPAEASSSGATCR
jgi:hypothetical protein